MRTAFIKTLEELAAKDKKIFFMTGDLGFSVVEEFQRKFPDQFLNAGIAEQNMIGMAAGLALSGRTVFAYSIANFPTLRPMEQVRNDVCYHEANVKIISVGSGLHYGGLGYTHHALEDLGIMRMLPGMVVLAPGDTVEAELATRAIATYKGPCYMRLGKGPAVHKGAVDFQIGKAFLMKRGKDLALITTGGMLQSVMEAAKKLEEKNISARVIQVHTIKPLDERAVAKAAKETGRVITVEEHSVIGGLGGAVAEVLGERGYPFVLRRIGVPDKHIKHVGSQGFLKEKVGLTTERIVLEAVKLMRSGA